LKRRKKKNKRSLKEFLKAFKEKKEREN